MIPSWMEKYADALRGTYSLPAPSPANSAPILNTIGNKTVVQKQLLSFQVSASDVDGDVLTYSVSNIPSGAIQCENKDLFVDATGVGYLCLFDI